MAASIMAPMGLDNYSKARHLRRDEVAPVRHRWHAVLSYHLAGYKVKEICELTGYSESTIYDILKNEEVRAVRQQIMSTLDDEFEALQGQVFDTVRRALDSPDPDLQMKAVEIWMKAHGRYKVNGGGGTNITAENVVMQIMNGSYPKGGE